MTSNRVQWKDIDPDTYEDMVSVLVSWLYPEAQRIDGSGGDGGRDVQIPTEDGLIIFQLKSFAGRMNTSRRRQVKASLKRASEHAPLRWYLVVPIHHTSGESEWFERLVEEYDFECRWLDKTWLDREMAGKPAIARYYAHDGRFALSELLDVLRSINATPPPIEDGIVNAAADHMRGVLQGINDLDPHYFFGLNLQPGGAVNVTIFPRYKGVEKDRPSPFRVKLAFPDTEEGKKAHQDLQASINYGTPSVISSEFIAELSLDLPAGLGGHLEGYELSIASPAPDLVDEADIVLKAVDQSGVVLARLPLEVERATKGMRGSQFSLRDKSGALTGTAQVDGPTSRFKMDWSFKPPEEFWPLDLLPAAMFVAALEDGAGTTVVVNGKDLPTQRPGGLQPADTGEASRYARFIEHLANVQVKTGAFFKVTDAITPEDEQAIVLSSRLLNGERVEDTWGELRCEVTPGGRESVEKALSGASRAVRLSAHMSLNIQRETIPIGRVTQDIESARVLKWEAFDDGDSLETTAVILVPGHTDAMTRFLNTDPV